MQKSSAAGGHSLQRGAPYSGVTCPGGQFTPGGYFLRDSTMVEPTSRTVHTYSGTLGSAQEPVECPMWQSNTTCLKAC